MVDVIVAKAVSESDSWVRVMALPHFSKMDESLYFQQWEEEAILLGVQMRKSLGLDIPIINDCQDAVRRKMYQYAQIFWFPRRHVRAAHNLKIARATKIYTPQLWEEEWEAEWEIGYEYSF
jgi:long-subunit fatty acid transport protein